MGYYANGGGFISFTRPLDDDEADKITDLLAEEFEGVEFNKANDVVSVWNDDKYHDDNVKAALSLIAETGLVKDASIEYAGEDRQLWRFAYIQWIKGFVEQEGRVVYD